jgi:hypothetical protein
VIKRFQDPKKERKEKGISCDNMERKENRSKLARNAKRVIKRFKDPKKER